MSKKVIMRKISVAAVCVILMMTSVTTVLAQTVSINMRSLGSYFKNYHNVLDWDQSGFQGKITVFKVNGDYAFCTQAGRMITDINGSAWDTQTPNITSNYDIAEITKDNSVQTKIAYLGFFRHKDNPSIWNNQETRDWYYAMTQMMIWQSLPAATLTANGYTNGSPNSYFTNESMAGEYAAFKTRIENEIKKWSIKPSFHGEKIDVEAGKSIILEDSNKVLADYNNFSYEKNGVSVSHSKGSNSMSVNVDFDCSGQVTMLPSVLAGAGAQKYDSQSKVTYLFEAPNSQDLAVYGNIGDPVDLALNFDVEPIRRPVEIAKKDAETGKLIPLAGASFEITNANTGEKIMGPSKEGFFITDKSGVIEISALQYGKYILTEKISPEGYLLSEPVEFVVDGTLEKVVVEVFDKPQRGIIKIQKQGEKLGEIKREDDGSVIPVYKFEPLSGAEFAVIASENIVTPDGTVRAQKGEVVDTMITDENGFSETKELYLGKYEILEKKAPAGYVLDDTRHFVELVYGGQEIEVAETWVNQGEAVLNYLEEKIPPIYPPEEPEMPEEPVEPEQPEEPETPDKPAEPEQPEEMPPTPNSPAEEVPVPKTGDNGNITGWLSFMGLMLCFVVSMSIPYKRGSSL